MADFSHIHEPYRSAHRACSCNRAVVENSALCGCFYCLAVYPASEVSVWIEDDGGDTAECPMCGIDSVIPDASGLPLDADFMKTMKRWWF